MKKHFTINSALLSGIKLKIFNPCFKSNNQFRSVCFWAFLLCFAVFCFNQSYAQPTLLFKSIAKNFKRPICVTNAGDGSGRLFICEEGGLVKIYKNGQVLSKPFLDVSSLSGEGLLSIAFHPQYKQNHLFYIYTNDFQGTIKLRVYKSSKQNADSAILSSGKIMYAKKSPSGSFDHNVGDLHFGKDGYLYVSLGDGDYEGDPNNQAQNGQLFSGKILRLNVNETNPPYYSIPPDNPFVNDPNVLDEIWALGLRNAWRWSFDRKTGDMWIGDVGQDSIEEIDYRTPAQSAGSNYGWRCYEGNLPYNTTGCANQNTYVFPIFTYPHVFGGGNSITGGYVYRGSSFSKLKGYYVCVDYVTGEAWKIKPNGLGGWYSSKQTGAPVGIVGFGEGEDAELYAACFDGNVYQVQTTASAGANKIDTHIADHLNSSSIKSLIYPTVVTNNTITLELKESYQTIRLIDMSGHETMLQSISNQHGRITINLPKLTAGMYIIQLAGDQIFQQKIYIAN